MTGQPVTDEQIGAYWDEHLAHHVADISDRDAVAAMRERYIRAVLASPAALQQLADLTAEQ